MSTTVRIILATVVSLALVALVVVGRMGIGPEPEPADTVLAHADCRPCHAAVWDEWERSFHSRAQSDPNVRAAFEHFRADRKCQTCHAPQPVLVTGIGEEVQLRRDDHQSGVNCLSCHGIPGGQGVAARRTIAEAPCRPVRRPELSDARICGTCHDAIHEDWLASSYHAEGKTCQQCHMPTVPDRDGGRSHIFLGGHDPEHMRSGVQWNCRRDADELCISVTNHATGHNFPGERHNRVLLLRVIERDADGQIVLYRQDTIKEVTPFRGESSAEKIRAGETYQTRFPVVERSVSADIRLLYRAFPWQSADEDMTVVHQTEMDLTKP